MSLEIFKKKIGVSQPYSNGIFLKITFKAHYTALFKEIFKNYVKIYMLLIFDLVHQL